MRGSKLYYFLIDLDRSELEDLKAFVDSPFFNKKEGPRLLLDYLLQIPGTLSEHEPALEEEAIFSALYPDRPFKAGVYNKLKNQTLDLLLRYFAQKEYDRDEGRENVYLLKAFNRRELRKYFPHYYQKSVERPGPFLEDHFETMFHLEMEKSWYHNQAANRSASPHFEDIFIHLRNDFLLRRLRLAVQAENLARVSQQEINLSRFNDLAQLRTRNIEALPLIGQLYHAIFMTLRYPDRDAGYQELVRLLNGEGADLPPNTALDFWLGALNYCVRKLNNGNLDFRREALNVYKQMEAAQLLSYTGDSFALHVKNIVSLSTQLKEFTYAGQFLDRLQDTPQVKRQPHLWTYNRGVYLFFMGEFAPAESAFNQIRGELEDIFYALDARTFLLRIYYETGNSIGMESMIHSFRVFLERNKKVPRASRKRYMTFIKYFRRLINLPPNGSKRVLKMKAEIEESGGISAKEWFLEKLEGLL